MYFLTALAIWPFVNISHRHCPSIRLAWDQIVFSFKRRPLPIKTLDSTIHFAI